MSTRTQILISCTYNDMYYTMHIYMYIMCNYRTHSWAGREGAAQFGFTARNLESEVVHWPPRAGHLWARLLYLLQVWTLNLGDKVHIHTWTYMVDYMQKYMEDSYKCNYDQEESMNPQRIAKKHKGSNFWGEIIWQRKMAISTAM